MFVGYVYTAWEYIETRDVEFIKPVIDLNARLGTSIVCHFVLVEKFKFISTYNDSVS